MSSDHDAGRESPANGGQWGDHRSAVAFTFDLDAELLWEAAAEQNPDFEGWEFRGKYGPEVGVPRILEVFERYDCKATFFIPGKVAEEWPTTVKRVHDAGHEIAHHTYSHRHPEKLDAEREEAEFKQTVDIFEDLVGEPPLGYRGGRSAQTLELAESVGMTYDSSDICASDIPYARSDADLIELPNAFMLDDFVFWGFNMSPPFEFQSGITPNGPVFDTWHSEFEALHRRGRMFMLTMHPQVIGRASRIDALDELVQRTVEADGAWVTTCSELADHWSKVTAGE